MIKLQDKLPKHVWLACSGGVDSMAALDFLRRKHKVTVLHYNHGTEHGNKAQEFVQEYCYTSKIPCIVGKATSNIPDGRSKEDWWREQRYNFLDMFHTVPVLTCHHLDDCVETWVWSSMHGTGKIVPHKRNHIIRPFRLTRKKDFERWANENNVPWVEDDSNANTCYTRNYVRHEMMPHVLKVNPGIHKTIKKKVKEDV